jgi:hypothetical protein
MIRKLPLFKGYTIDIKLGQFRKISKEDLVFIDFDSEEGEHLLHEWINLIDKNDPLLEELF